MNNTVYLYVFDTMSDWEIGYLTSELNSGRYFKKGFTPSKIVTVGIEKALITTMGGLKILPDITLNELVINKTDTLILPGGETWTEKVHQPVLKIAQMCLNEGALVAAICGATIGLAKTGLLNSRSHTSNDLGYLKMICPSYTGEKHYIVASAVTDENLITASGIAPLEFTVHVLNAMEVFSSQTSDAWYHLNKTQESRYFYELMNSISQI